MVLHTQTPASHNRMLGHRTRHPPSTNYDEDFATPTPKRLKRLDSTDSSLSRRLSDNDDEIRQTSPPGRLPPREIPDSEAESDEDEEPVPNFSHKTDLESALPPVKTDKEAIAEYEATRAAEGNLDLYERLGQRKWVKGKSSIYVDAFNLALETVLEDESHLFDEAEMAIFKLWRNLSYEGQYLWVDVLVNMTLDIIRLERLNYSLDMSGCSSVKPPHGTESTA